MVVSSKNSHWLTGGTYLLAVAHPDLQTCCTVADARVVKCVQAYAKVSLLYRVTRHVAST
jgi:hypothetical protein